MLRAAAAGRRRYFGCCADLQSASNPKSERFHDERTKRPPSRFAPRSGDGVSGGGIVVQQICHRKSLRIVYPSVAASPDLNPTDDARTWRAPLCSPSILPVLSKPDVSPATFGSKQRQSAPRVAAAPFACHLAWSMRTGHRLGRIPGIKAAGTVRVSGRARSAAMDVNPARFSDNRPFPASESPLDRRGALLISCDAGTGRRARGQLWC